MTATVLPWWTQQYLDDDGNPLAGGKLYFFQTGTDTPVAVFQDADLSVEWSVPLVLDAAGRVPGSIYPPVSPALDIRLDDADDVPVVGPLGPIIAVAPAEEPAPPCTPVAIVTQPVNQSVSTGDSATVSVVATGTSPITYQWYLGSSGDTSNPILGAVGSSYTTVALAAGTYTGWVRTANGCGSADSLTVTIVAS